MNQIIFCHLLNDFSGSPKVLAETVSALKKQSSGAKIFVGSGSEGFLSDCGVPVSRYWYVRSKYRLVTLFTYFFSQICLFFALLLDRSIEKNALIYVNTLLPFGAALYGKLTGRRVLYHIHEVSISPAPLRLYLTSVVKCTSSLNIYVSRAHMEMLPIAGVAARCIHNTLEQAFQHAAMASPYTPRHDGIFKVLMVASLRDYKGIPELLALVDALAERDDIRFDLVVNGELADIDAYFSDKKCPPHLTVHPRTMDTPAFYAAASLVLNLSRVDTCQETFGLTILEAIAFGVPVIVPPVGGPAELIADAVQGFLIDSRDTRRLCAGVLALADDASLCGAMSQAARLRAQDFAHDKFATALGTAIAEVQ
ncbi:glycosyltransferase family 4 protein [Janthinobacterium agaricidamnosum]|uniref:Glycosyl transferases group 1 family protein n=1 Tax=Janthinobacterium agaricidamnosum NBRC 102515 = DSM 9628 TaxID=1349767 RepID=W0V2M2_9BURK|nr:glycosyltransferase family 4 protein [Janthinobacterium agaricidamnosum]CDG81598.1 glycosyl transferases group 1 family protein [Janthinobacterium agaricidamnosum NBRC 102515 = DSM 9628]